MNRSAFALSVVLVCGCRDLPVPADMSASVLDAAIAPDLVAGPFDASGTRLDSAGGDGAAGDALGGDAAISPDLAPPPSDAAASDAAQSDGAVAASRCTSLGGQCLYNAAPNAVACRPGMHEPMIGGPPIGPCPTKPNTNSICCISDRCGDRRSQNDCESLSGCHWLSPGFCSEVDFCGGHADEATCKQTGCDWIPCADGAACKVAGNCVEPSCTSNGCSESESCEPCRLRSICLPPGALC